MFTSGGKIFLSESWLAQWVGMGHREPSSQQDYGRQVQANGGALTILPPRSTVVLLQVGLSQCQEQPWRLGCGQSLGNTGSKGCELILKSI